MVKGRKFLPGGVMFNCLCEMTLGHCQTLPPRTIQRGKEPSAVISGCEFIPATPDVFSDNEIHGSRSDWTLDVTHPGVDAEEGWQYAPSFSDPDERWRAERPHQLERLLGGNGTMTVGLGGNGTRTRSSSSGSSSSSRIHPANHPQMWVRRRRWVRVMRRRLDIPPLPFLQPDGQMYHLATDGSLIPHVEHDESVFSDGGGQELTTMRTGALSVQDYVARARYLAGSQHGSGDSQGTDSALEARRAIAKLERATTELRQGISSMASVRITLVHDLIHTGIR